MSSAGPRLSVDARVSGRLTVQGWFRVVFVVMAVLLIGAAAIIAAAIGHDRTLTNQLQASILQAQTQAYRLQAALIDQETGVRGYGITADPQFLQPIHARPRQRSRRGGAAAQADRRATAAGRRPQLIEHGGTPWRRVHTRSR